MRRFRLFGAVSIGELAGDEAARRFNISALLQSSIFARATLAAVVLEDVPKEVLWVESAATVGASRLVLRHVTIYRPRLPVPPPELPRPPPR